ncbi:hypothetical protein, variant 1 [Aphanomyces invadans]|uniref:Peptidase S33 tripeptidyl aminopeptidase-like C-terminal domain-containing protein n=1 Tax=Aphanomyces invadans TaxID=157072 RepID=A0A024UG39_9STRA|nr:hypothetical protein, variant 1 [Aphanomyces invadans]ETW04598.1 hypothetical protein, variant 1 [Aphanomyces invadans]|eukprot:XP_008866035.1 hypothetical protein, variant 1 [Aphanomyces invadans]
MAPPPLDGWYRCSESTFGGSGGLVAECGKYTMPLCHPGLCNDTSRTLDVFVKRVLAANTTANPKVLWMVQGGPGLSSADLDGWLADMYTMLHGQVTLMTMDHRGVGRSSYLTCTAAQATTGGSPGGRDITRGELPACLASVRRKFGASNSAAFSITSAATDLLTVIDATSLPAQEVYVYGVSYGTMWVQRAMLLEPHFPATNIRGYILDGVVTHSGPRRLVFSDWDTNHGRVASAYFDLCTQDAFCAAKFVRSTLAATAAVLYTRLNGASHPCHAFVQTNFGDAAGLKILFSSYLQDPTLRALIPVLVYRLERCNAGDIVVLQTILNSIHGLVNMPRVGAAYYSELVRNVVGYSELWELPTPTLEALQERFDSSIVASGMFNALPEYCIYSGATDPACVATNSVVTPSVAFVYTPDAYFNQTVVVPSKASVLLLNGGLDPQTPLFGAHDTRDLLQSARKLLVEFPYCTHGIVGMSITTNASAPPCGQSILASYVMASGDLAAVDTSCLHSLRPMSFQLSLEFAATVVPGIAGDLYDGTLPLSATAPPSKLTTIRPLTTPLATTAMAVPSPPYFVEFAILCELVVVAAVAVGLLTWEVRLRAARRRRNVQEK